MLVEFYTRVVKYIMGEDFELSHKKMAKIGLDFLEYSSYRKGKVFIEDHQSLLEGCDSALTS